MMGRARHAAGVLSWLTMVIFAIGCARPAGSRAGGAGKAGQPEYAQQATHEPREEEAHVPLLPGMGFHHVPISTKVEKAQQSFDQGLILSYGFNHAGAEASF